MREKTTSGASRTCAQTHIQSSVNLAQDVNFNVSDASKAGDAEAFKLLAIAAKPCKQSIPDWIRTSNLRLRRPRSLKTT